MSSLRCSGFPCLVLAFALLRSKVGCGFWYLLVTVSFLSGVFFALCVVTMVGPFCCVVVYLLGVVFVVLVPLVFVSCIGRGVDWGGVLV